MESAAQEADRKHRLGTLVGAGLVVSTVTVLGGVAAAIFVTTGGRAMGDVPPDYSIIRLILIVLSLTETPGVLWFFRYWLVPRTMRSKADTGSQTPASYLFSMTIVIWALCESPAIFGFVLFVYGGQWMDAVALSMLTLLFAFIFAPRRETWHQWLGFASAP